MTDAHAGPDTASVLFDPEPETWGLRGDPYLWRALREYLADARLPRSADELTGRLPQRLGAPPARSSRPGAVGGPPGPVGDTSRASR